MNGVCLHMQAEDPWGVRVLPKVAFGVHPLGLDGVGPDDPDIVVLHQFLGSWKVPECAARATPIFPNVAPCGSRDPA